MAVWCKKGTFVKATATGIQSLNLGTPEQGKAIFIWSSNGQTAAGKTDGMQFSFGMADANEGVCYYGRADDNQATQDTAEAHAGSGAVIRTVAQSQADENTAFVDTWTATGIDLNWTFNDGVASVWHYMVFGGSGLLAELASNDTPSTTGNASVTAAGFRPKFALIVCGFSFFPAVDLDDCQFPNIGVTDGTRHGAAYVVSEDTNPTDTHRYQRTDRFMVMGNASTGAPLIETTLTSLDADGFTHNFVATSANLRYRAMCFGGDEFQVYVGSNTQPTAIGTQTLTSTGVSRPIGMLAFSVGAAASTSLQTEARFCLGAADINLTQGYVWCGDTDNVTPSVSARELNTTALIGMGTPAATGSSSTTEAQAAVTAFNNSTVDLNWSTVDATGRQFIYAVFGGGDLVIDPEGTPTAPFVDGDISIPLTWIQITTNDGTTKAYAEVDLNDRDVYYYGYKAPWVLGFLPISRGASDYRGQGESLSFGARFSDTERYFRGLLADATNKYLPGRPLAEWMIGDEERRAEELARLIAVGYLAEYEFPPKMQFEIRGHGWIERKFLRTRRLQQAWQPVVLEADFGTNTDLSDDTVNLPVPIYYGYLRDTTPAHQGAVSVIYTGIRDVGGTNYHEFVVMRLASKGIEEVYVDNVVLSAGEITSDWLIPGDAAWTSAFGAATYRTFNSRRYTIIYGQDGATKPDAVAAGDSVLTLNLQGVEDIGDGTGTLISSIPLQFLHFLNNFIAPDTGVDTSPYLTADDSVFEQLGSPAPTLVDEASFLQAYADLADRIGGSPAEYAGAGCPYDIGEEIGAYDAMARFCVSGDFSWYYNRKGQVAITVEPIAEVAGAEPLDDVISILGDSFGVDDLVDREFFNAITYVWNRDYTGRSRSGFWSKFTAEDTTSITSFGLYRISPRFEFYFLRGSSDLNATQDDVVARLRARFRQPIRRVMCQTSLGGLQYEIGDVVPLTHVEGLGASGWEGRKVRVIRHEVHPTEGRVLLECYDMADIWAANDAYLSP